MIDAPAGGPRAWLTGSHTVARAGRLNGLLALLFFVFAGGSEATARSLTAPDHIELHSNVLGEERSVDVWLPENYDETASKKYDVLYVLDGEWDTQTCRNIDGYLVAIGFAPENEPAQSLRRRFQFAGPRFYPDGHGIAKIRRR